MTGVQISQVRWPVELYEWICDTAHERRQSINKTIVELINEVRDKNRNFI